MAAGARGDPPVPGADAGTVRLSVADAESLARKNNPQISIARLNALASQQTVVAVKSAEYPTFSANLTGVAAHQGGRITAGGLNNPVVYDRAAGRTGGEPAHHRLRKDVEPRRELGAARPGRGRKVDGHGRADSSWPPTMLSTTRSGPRRSCAWHAQTVSARRSVADRVQALADSKLKSDLDASFAQVNLAEANLLLLDAESNEKAALATLSAVLGFPDLQNFELVDEAAGPVAPPGDVEFLIAQALSRRPEVAALDLDARAAERFHLAERDLALPNIRAMGVVGGAPFRNEILSPWYGAVGINVEIPIFNGFLFGARSAESDLRARAARERLLDLRNSVARDVRTSWLDASAAYARLAVSRQLLDQASLALSLAQTRYDLGLSSIVELSQAQLQQTRAEIDDTEARYRYLMAQSTLQYQLGGV